MIGKGIQIRWDSSVEYVEIDPSNLKNKGEISSTIEWWPAEKAWVKYNTKSQIVEKRNGLVEIRLIYEPSNNPHLDPNEISFGKSTISISPGQNSGQVRWKDNSGAHDSGESKWTHVAHPLVGRKKRVAVTRIQRKQQEFRKALIVLDEKCVLTGESTDAALEAAHIIPASLGGTEIIGNGILLRADLHRLLDSKQFSIDENGKIITENSLSQAYKTLLKNKSLPSHVKKRVKEALVRLQSI